MTKPFGQYLQEMTLVQQAQFAERADLHPNHLRFRIARAERKLSPGTCALLAKASEGLYTEEEIRAWHKAAHAVYKRLRTI
jgi:hypothetical protein